MPAAKPPDFIIEFDGNTRIFTMLFAALNLVLPTFMYNNCIGSPLSSTHHDEVFVYVKNGTVIWGDFLKQKQDVPVRLQAKVCQDG